MVMRCRGGGCAASKAGTNVAADGPRAPAGIHAVAEAATSALIQDLSLDETAATVLQQLRPLDEELVAALQRSDIRLVRAAWLRTRPDGYRLQHRQGLEALERGDCVFYPLC